MALLKQDGWKGFPSGNEKPVMELALSKFEIESRYGLSFIYGEDSLGRAYSTYFNDDVLGTVTIILYETYERAMVFVDVGLELDAAVLRLLEVFDLDRSLVNIPAHLA